MFTQLESDQYDRVRPLFAELAAYNVSIPALLDGVNPGAVYVDDPDAPQAALLATVEGHHLAGDPTQTAFIAAVNADLRTNHYNDEVTVWGDEMVLCVSPDTWRDVLPALLAPRDPLVIRRRHYVCTALKMPDWRDRLPAGFVVRRIDDDLLDQPGLTVPEHIRSWINHNWGTRSNFNQHGFGFCVLHGETVASWTVADCASGDRCEIGIRTNPAYRRRGLAALVVSAAVEHALTNGFVEVGWHCHEANIGSWKTAEKVGFRHERDYLHYYCMFSSVHHLAETGWMALDAGQPQAAVAACEQLFAISDDFPPDIYFMAARAHAATGDSEQALFRLNTAIDRGWDDRATITGCTEFTGLHDMPAWEAVLARLRAGS